MFDGFTMAYSEFSCENRAAFSTYYDHNGAQHWIAPAPLVAHLQCTSSNIKECIMRFLEEPRNSKLKPQVDRINLVIKPISSCKL